MNTYITNVLIILLLIASPTAYSQVLVLWGTEHPSSQFAPDSNNKCTNSWMNFDDWIPTQLPDLQTENSDFIFISEGTKESPEIPHMQGIEDTNVQNYTDLYIITSGLKSIFDDFAGGKNISRSREVWKYYQGLLWIYHSYLFLNTTTFHYPFAQTVLEEDTKSPYVKYILADRSYFQNPELPKEAGLSKLLDRYFLNNEPITEKYIEDMLDIVYGYVTFSQKMAGHLFATTIEPSKAIYNVRVQMTEPNDREQLIWDLIQPEYLFNFQNLNYPSIDLYNVIMKQWREYFMSQKLTDLQKLNPHSTILARVGYAHIPGIVHFLSKSKDFSEDFMQKTFIVTRQTNPEISCDGKYIVEFLKQARESDQNLQIITNKGAIPFSHWQERFALVNR